MEPFVFSEIRRSMGLSISQMATMVGLDGANATDRVREMERGARPISGPLLRLLGYMAQTVDLQDGSAASVMAKLLPRWLDCSDMESAVGGASVIMHTRWPRFLGWETNDIPADLADMLKAANIPVVPMSTDLGLGVLVVLFIDRPGDDARAVIAEGVRLKELRARRHLNRNLKD